MTKKQPKTNAMRQLEAAGIAYEALAYECDGKNFDGELVAEQVGLSPAEVYKTLVVRGENNRIVVCCVPVNAKLDLKALAADANCKRLEMIQQEELPALTGYLRGGCSPIGMKKQYPTFIDQAVLSLENVAVSAGVRGLQLWLQPQGLLLHTNAKTGQYTQQNL